MDGREREERRDRVTLVSLALGRGAGGMKRESHGDGGGPRREKRR